MPEIILLPLVSFGAVAVGLLVVAVAAQILAEILG